MCVNELLITKLTVVPLITVLGVTVKSESVRSSCSERTSQSNRSEKITLGSHGNSAFQPITASCKIIPQGQVPSPAESPGKSFQPITMSCKIVSGESHRCTKKVEKSRFEMQAVKSSICRLFHVALAFFCWRFRFSKEKETVRKLWNYSVMHYRFAVSVWQQI